MVEASIENKSGNWFRGHISAVLLLDQATCIAACGRQLLLFRFGADGEHSLVHEQATCLPTSMKINALERIPGTASRFIVRSDRTFAVYHLASEDSSDSFELVYYHGTKAIDQITRVRVSNDGTVGILLAHNFAQTFNLDMPDSIVTETSCQEEPCILYSGDIDVEKNVVAAGTVFRVLLVWELSSGTILQKLLGHTGVIFDTLLMR